MSLVRDSVDGGLVTAGAAGQATSYATDSCYADASQVMDFSIGEIFLQVFDDLPPVDQRLEFRGRTQIIEEVAHFSRVSQRQQSLE